MNLELPNVVMFTLKSLWFHELKNEDVLCSINFLTVCTCVSVYDRALHCIQPTKP